MIPYLSWIKTSDKAKEKNKKAVTQEKSSWFELMENKGQSFSFGCSTEWLTQPLRETSSDGEAGRKTLVATVRARAQRCSLSL